VSAGGVTERKVRGDEVGAVLVSVGRRHPTHVDHLRVYSRESSVGSVEPSVGLGCVEIFQFFLGWVGLGWVGSTTAKVLKTLKDYVNAFKARLDKISRSSACLQQSGPWVRLNHRLGWVASRFFQFFVGWVGLGWVYYSKSTKDVKGLC